jgi:signal transduction histidine kinase
VKELNGVLREQAMGQLICLPIYTESDAFGMACFAHTRRNLLTDKEMNFLHATIASLADMAAYEILNQQARVQIISEERERIGMDLHDGIIQSLYGIGLSLENARMSQVQGKSNSVQQIEKALEALQSAIADIRAYILDLRPRQLRHANMVEGMRSLIREFRANTMVDVTMEGEPEDVEGMARPQIDALYHIFQEALSNTAKHAKASKVTVRLWRRGDRVMLKVSDDGTGFETPRPGGRIGHGLTNMQARAEAAGGGMEVISIRKQGTTLLAWVPYVKE